jgi:hypothetical protein
VYRQTVVIAALVALAAVVVACSGSDDTDADTASDLDGESQASAATHDLTHSATDAEFVVDWDSIVSKCPEVAGLQRVEAFARRGEEVQIDEGSKLAVEADGPAAWTSRRSVTSDGEGGSRRFQVSVSYLEKRGDAEGQVRLTAQRTSAAAQMMGGGGMSVSVEEGMGFVVVRLDSSIPIKSEQRFVAGDNLLVHFVQTVRAGPTQLCGAEQLAELARDAGLKMDLLKLTPLP